MPPPGRSSGWGSLWTPTFLGALALLPQARRVTLLQWLFPRSHRPRSQRNWRLRGKGRLGAYRPVERVGKTFDLYLSPP